MNLMDRLRDARPAHLGDTAIDERTRAAELSYAMARGRQVAARRRWARPAWGLALTGAAAAVTAVAVTVSSGTGGAPAPTLAVATPGSSGAPSATEIELSASAVLLAAAERADRQPDTMKAYWHTATATSHLVRVKGGYTFMDQGRSESWTPSAVGGQAWGRSQSLGAKPATPEDEAAWRAAGAPKELRVKVPGKKGELLLPVGPGRVRVEHHPLVNGDKVFWLGRNVTMKEVRGLPSDPAKLKAWLLRAYGGHGTESASTPMSSDEWLFTVASGLITDMPVTSRTRGAAFRMLAGLKSIKVVHDVTDAEGRTGTAVTIEQASHVRDGGTPDGVLEARLIFDEATGRALGTDNVVVRPGGYQADLAPGTVWHSTSILEAGWTDSKPSS
ncbi:CU044_5270 family protein [Sphaerisporangium sp. B11E5]|uniref:CU044_5270 family protein n=1 Tax=Sphaerisporangium sp. B11E5 TaxID=3153563 RepID=UPI00325D1868